MRSLPDQKFEGEYLFAARRRVMVLPEEEEEVAVGTMEMVEEG